MKDERSTITPGITSFLIECLIWNVSNDTFNNNETWQERVKVTINSLYSNTREGVDYTNFLEVSNRYFLFHEGRIWTVPEVNSFLINWNFSHSNANEHSRFLSLLLMCSISIL